MTKANLSQLLRKIGLLRAAEQVKFRLRQWQMRSRNRTFLQSHSNVAFPPDYMMFESFRLDYRKYYEGGRNTAEWVWNQIRPHIKSSESGKILDWGCGPARVVRHMPALLGENWVVYGTDYNRQTIAWCQKNITAVSFSVNGVSPPLPFEDNFFDALYGISIFTHLSEENHASWLSELLRVSKPGAILLFTTQGKSFRARLTKTERIQFDQGRLVVRAKVKEGHRLFSAFHPPTYLEEVFSKNTTIIRHQPGEVMDWGIEQDTWVLRKNEK